MDMENRRPKKQWWWVYNEVMQSLLGKQSVVLRRVDDNVFGDSRKLTKSLSKLKIDLTHIHLGFEQENKNTEQKEPENKNTEQKEQENKNTEQKEQENSKEHKKD